MIKEDWVNPKIEVKTISDKGKGMFATSPIRVGETLIVWGNNFTLEDIKKIDTTDKLVIQWDDNLFSVEEPGKEAGYFINHSCDSNTWMIDAFTVVARRDISTGEEITIDYVIWVDQEDYVSEWGCKCGEPNCRKVFTGKDWKIPELQERYKGHFSPLINKRIANLNNF